MTKEYDAVDANVGRRDIVRSGLAGAIGLAGGLTGGGAFLSIGAKALGLAKINFQISWVHGGNQIGEVCAKRMGFYEQEGIELNIVQGGPNIDGLALVAAGRFEVGQLSSTPSLMIATSQGVPVKCFAVAAQRHPYTFFSLKNNPIRSPRDMIGKRIGTQATSLVLLRALMAKNGIDHKDVTIVTIGSDMRPLLHREVDAAATWLTNVPSLKILGTDRVDLRLWDTGVRLYALPYYATVQTIQNRLHMLAKFLRATSKGWEYAFTNREKAVGLLIAEFPQLDVDEEKEAAETMLSHVFNEATRLGGWGIMDQTIWADQIELFARLGQFPKRVPTVGDVATMDILNATSNERARLG